MGCAGWELPTPAMDAVLSLPRVCSGVGSAACCTITRACLLPAHPGARLVALPCLPAHSSRWSASPGRLSCRPASWRCAAIPAAAPCRLGHGLADWHAAGSTPSPGVVQLGRATPARCPVMPCPHPGLPFLTPLSTGRVCHRVLGLPCGDEPLRRGQQRPVSMSERWSSQGCTAAPPAIHGCHAGWPLSSPRLLCPRGAVLPLPTGMWCRRSSRRWPRAGPWASMASAVSRWVCKWQVGGSAASRSVWHGSS